MYKFLFLYVWLSFQWAKHKGYEGDLVCRWQWGGGDGLHPESDWEVWRSAPLEVI